MKMIANTTYMVTKQQNSITDIIKAYSNKLMNFIKQRVRQQADAEDILQDVFYQLIENVSPIEQISGWLFAVARNKIIDRGRKKSNELINDIFTDDDNDEEINWKEYFLEENDNPETTYLRSLFWEQLNVAIQELPEAQRSVFILNELEGIPFKVIAEETGETVNTLLSRKRYAVIHLRKRLQILKDELLHY